MPTRPNRKRLIAALVVVFGGLMLGGCGPSHSEFNKAVIFHSAKGNVKCLRILLNEYPDGVNARYESGATPLHFAACHGQKDAASFLISRGAEVNARNNLGWTPLALADNNDVRQLLIKHGGVEQTELHRAVCEGNLAKVKSILAEKPEEINTLSKGHTLLDVTIERSDITIAQYLISKRADVNALNAMAWTPLHRAVLNRQTEMIELLIASGANVNAKDLDGHTPLYWAADDKVADLLREHGAVE